MSKELTTFDYGSVDKDTKGKLTCLAGQIKRGKGSHIKSIIEIGSAIHEAHELLAGNGRDGKFREWVELECGIEKSTAYNYLHSFEAFAKCDVLEQFSPTAMYALAAPTAPDKARKEAIKRAGKGERIIKTTADEIIESFTVPETSVQPLDTLSPCATTPGAEKTPPAAVGDCPRGGNHERDEDGTCTKCKDPPVEKPTLVDNDFTRNVAKGEAKDAKVCDLFKTLLEHVRQSVLLVDQIHNATGKKHGKLHEACINHVDVFSQEVHGWRRVCK